MKAPLLSELRAAPIVGRFYIVPVVNFPWHERIDDWPVLGPLHEDTSFFSFPDHHYHLDARFLSARQRSFVERHGRRSLAYRSATVSRVGDAVEFAVIAFPLTHRDFTHAKGRPTLARRRCGRASFACGAVDRRILQMRAHYGDPAAPIRRRDGRLLCPHRKVDLSQFTPDSDGIVTCPLHGLRVRCT